MFGWGVGFYGPAIFLHTVVETRGWSVGIVSAAVTAHFLLGAALVANMPAIYARFGLPRTTMFSAVCLALGTAGWALAAVPWQLFAATLISAVGWAGTGAMAVNTAIAPRFEIRRPAARSMAYNGASIGGVLFSPVWVFLIALLGFPVTAAIIGAVLINVLSILSVRYFSKTPQNLGGVPDGETDVKATTAAKSLHSALPGRPLWINRAFVTCTVGFSIVLFAQIGICAHLFSLLVPALGTQAGFAAGFATACAVAGRSLVGWFLPPAIDRRLAAALTYLVQAFGCLAFVLAGGESITLLLLGVCMFGVGIGNVTSLPPLIADAEFAPTDVPRAIALSTAAAQATFAFAPALFGLLREWETILRPVDVPATPVFFLAAGAFQAAGAIVYMIGWG